MNRDVDHEEFEPIECAPLPVAIEAYDVEVGGPSTMIRLFFTPRLGADPRPGNLLSNVLVFEQWDRVAIGLVRRVVAGDGPDGTVYGGEPLIQGTQVSLDVDLREPLGTRPLVDASTGHAVPRVERVSTDLLPAEAAGTPRWIPF
jgi:hypothetical protein